MWEKLWKELVKITPLFVFMAFAVWYSKTDAALKMGVYFMALMALNMAIFQIVRKFLWPTLSLEAHFKSVLEEQNLASALLLIAIFASVITMCALNTWFVMAGVR